MELALSFARLVDDEAVAEWLMRLERKRGMRVKGRVIFHQCKVLVGLRWRTCRVPPLKSMAAETETMGVCDAHSEKSRRAGGP